MGDKKEMIASINSLLQRLTQRIWKLLGLAFLVIALSSCNLAQFKTEAAQVSQLVVATPSGPTTFNYPLNESLFSVFSYIYEGLITENGLTGTLEPALAEKWEISPDKRRIVFTLREGLKWSDGHALTVDDVIFTYNDIYLNPKIPSGTKDILRIGTTGKYPTVKKLDERRVEFTVPEPFAPFLRYAGGLYILPAHALKAAVNETDKQGNLRFLSLWGTDTDPQKIVGNGLYRMQSYAPSQRIIFERNPYYWQKDEQGNPQPYIERIIWQIIESTDNQLMNFRSGELDTLGVQPEAFPLLKREEKRGKYTIYNGGPEIGSRFLGFNLNKAKNDKGQPFVDPTKSRWFNTLEFRQAVAYAIDRDTMKKNIFRGLGDFLNSPIPVQSPYYLSPEKGLKVYDYTPEKAKQLLKQAGFKYNPRGELLDWDGKRVQFNLLVKAEEKFRVDMAAQIQRNLNQIGIKADLQVVAFNTIVEKLSSRNWEAYVGGFGGGGIEPHSGFNIWSSQGSLHQFNQGQQPGEPEIQGWEVSDWEQEIDQLFDVGVKELDETKRKEIYGRFQQLVQEQLPFIHLVNPLNFEAVRDHIQGIEYSALGGAFWNLHELQVMQ